MFRKTFGCQKFTDNMGEVSNFKPKVFRLTVPKSLVSESYSVLLFSDNENFFFSEGYVASFFGTFLSRGTQKLRKGIFCALFQKICGTENFMGK